MPHTITNRPRQFALGSDKPAGHKIHWQWEAANGVLYLLGGLTFIAGSIFFLPAIQADHPRAGEWIFFGGSLLYLVVTLHDLLESLGYLRSHGGKTLWNMLDFSAALVYVGGTILFTVGSIFFLPAADLESAGAWCFIIGSLLFLVGPFINIVQIVKAASLTRLQLLNATAVSFALGALLFLVASIPYLWDLVNGHDSRVLFTYVGWEYVTGSVLFLLGGIFNFYRASLVVRETRGRSHASLGAE